MAFLYLYNSLYITYNAFLYLYLQSPPPDMDAPEADHVIPEPGFTTTLLLGAPKLLIRMLEKGVIHIFKNVTFLNQFFAK